MGTSSMMIDTELVPIVIWFISHVLNIVYVLFGHRKLRYIQHIFYYTVVYYCESVIRKYGPLTIILFILKRYPNEQNHSFSFNKAMLMNIAYIVASNLSDYDCLVFHDVDFIAEDDRSMYMCRENPLHLGAWHDSHEYKL